MGETCEGRDQYGYSPEERGRMSSESVVCGMMGCGVPPEQTCRFCGLWYCVKHHSAHYAGYPEHKTENQSL
jgi:hypothetical protein